MDANDQIHWVKLPKVCSRKEIPVDPSAVATPFKLKKMQYLDCITNKIASDNALSMFFWC